MKKIRILTVLAAMLLSCGIAIAQTVKGDVNQDQKLNAKDITALADSVMKNKQSKRLDLNEDGKVNVADVTQVLNLIGAQNAVKKAHQLTDIEFTLLLPIAANSRTYNPGKNYKGIIYSSVKELGTYVGSNVSFHTFMTAIHNPRSKIYTETLNKAPYHGTNCKAYYGTVCSGLVSYALGLDYGSYDFPVSEVMEEVDFSVIDNVHTADVLWKSGHVALITDVVRNEAGYAESFEICEAVQTGCKRYSVSREKFEGIMSSSFKKIFRYKEIYKNTSYTPAPEFVAVGDETPVVFEYNNDLCADKGDKACYAEDEDVIINVMHDYDYMDIYKDDSYYMTIQATQDSDVVLKDLKYGDYKACISYGSPKMKSDFTFWKVVNMELSPDRSNGLLYFKSTNALPYKIGFSNISGSRKYPHTQLYSHTLTDEERERGYVVIPPDLTRTDYPYIRFSFSTDYGKILCKPINWFE